MIHYSGMVHTGYDSTPGTLEHDLLKKSRTLNSEFYKSKGLPIYTCGAIVAAKSPSEVGHFRLSKTNTLFPASIETGR